MYDTSALISHIDGWTLKNPIHFFFNTLETPLFYYPKFIYADIDEIIIYRSSHLKKILFTLNIILYYVINMLLYISKI